MNVVWIQTTNHFKAKDMNYVNMYDPKIDHGYMT